MEIIVKIVQLIFALSLLVVVHEFGHYIFSRIFGIRVEKFYLFFPPAIIKYKSKKSGTEWGIGSIPLGGFCKISGMIDESMDKESLKNEPQKWEFRSKPAWQRLFVLAGGVLFNVILSIVLFSAILYTWGEQYLRNEDALYGIEVNSLSEELGFRNGDKILSFDGIECEDFNQLWITLARNQARTATVLRGDDTITINIDPAYMPAILNNPDMFRINAPIAVGQIPEYSPNYSSGLKPGDRFNTVNGREVRTFGELQNALEGCNDKTMEATFIRDGEEIRTQLICDSLSKLNIIIQKDIRDFHITTHEYTLAESIPAGLRRAGNTISDYIKELGLIFTPKTEAYKSVGSIIAIGNIFPGMWNWQILWNLIAWLSVMLAILNLLPIPGLDGGHIMFTLYEMISGKKPSDKFLATAQAIGMTILLFIFIFAFGNDIFRLFN